MVTDNTFRNRAISSFILNSGTYPLATFAPTSLAGMPASVAVGETFSFTITGDLTLRDITQPVTFEVTVTAEAADWISGKATATVRRADFSLKIPSVPQVAWRVEGRYSSNSTLRRCAPGSELAAVDVIARVNKPGACQGTPVAFSRG